MKNETLSRIREIEERRTALAREREMLRHRADAGEDGAAERIRRLETATGKANDELEELSEKLKRYNVIERLANDPRHTDAGSDPGTGRTREDARRVEANKAGGLRALDTYVRSGELRPEAPETLEAVVRRDSTPVTAHRLEAVGDPAYASAFAKVLADPVHGHLRFTPEEVAAFQRASFVQAEERAMSLTTTAGGFMVPLSLDPSILLTSSSALNPIRSLARVIVVGTESWKGVSSAGVTAAYQAEAAEAADAAPTLAQPAIDVAMGRAFVPFSIELGQDSPTLLAELATLISDARDVLDATQMLTGTGTDSPAGVLTGLSTSQRVQCAAANFPAVADHYSLKAAVPARFSTNLTWAAHPAQWDRSYRLTPAGSTTEPQMMVAREGNILGRPKVGWSTMANVSTAGSKLIIAGDFGAAMTIADRIGMSVELVPHLVGASFRPTGQRGLFAYWRTGSKVVVPEALRYLETV